MDVLGIEIRKGAWAVAHLRSSLFGARIRGFFLLKGEDAQSRIEELKGYVSDNGLKGARAAVVLPRESAVTGVLRVPAPGAGAVEGVLKFEMEKHIPFAPEDTLSSFHVLKNEKNIFSVLFAAAEKGAVDEAVNCFTGSGLGLSSLVPWQTAVYNALYDNGSLRTGRNTAFVWINPEETRIEVFESAHPAYSTTVRVNRHNERWIEEVKKELRSYLARTGAKGKRLDDCVVMDETGDAPAEAGIDHFLSSELEAPAQALRLGRGGSSAAAPAIGAALVALGSSRAAIDLGGGSRLRASTEQRRTLSLGLAAGVLLLITAASYPAKDWIAERTLNASVSGVESEREKAVVLARELKSLEERLTALEDIEGSTAGVLDSLMELTETVPRDTYLTGFEYDGTANGSTVTIEGISERASSVLLRMERSGRIKAPEFVGPVAKDPGGKERFRIKFASGTTEKKGGRQ